LTKLNTLLTVQPLGGRLPTPLGAKHEAISSICLHSHRARVRTGSALIQLTALRMRPMRSRTVGYYPVHAAIQRVDTALGQVERHAAHRSHRRGDSLPGIRLRGAGGQPPVQPHPRLPTRGGRRTGGPIQGILRIRPGGEPVPTQPATAALWPARPADPRTNIPAHVPLTATAGIRTRRPPTMRMSSSRSVAAPGSHRTERDILTSYGSCLNGIQTSGN
jgi:hypothetical protein